MRKEGLGSWGLQRTAQPGGRRHRPLPGRPLGNAHLSRFIDGEIWFPDPVQRAGGRRLRVQPTGRPPTRTRWSCGDARCLQARERLARDRGDPVYGYARQDRKDRPRVRSRPSWWPTCSPPPAPTACLHGPAPARSRGSSYPVDHMFAAPVIIATCCAQLPKLTVVSPDAGGVERARAYAKRWRLRSPSSTSVATRPTSRGAPRGRRREGPHPLIVDDIVDTGGTLAKVAQAVKEAGARECCLPSRRIRAFGQGDGEDRREPAVAAHRHRLHPLGNRRRQREDRRPLHRE